MPAMRGRGLKEDVISEVGPIIIESTQSYMQIDLRLKTAATTPGLPDGDDAASDNTATKYVYQVNNLSHSINKNITMALNEKFNGNKVVPSMIRLHLAMFYTGKLLAPRVKQGLKFEVKKRIREALVRTRVGESSV